MRRLIFLISAVCLTVFLFKGSAWAAPAEVRASSDIRNSGEISLIVDFCGAQGPNGTKVDIVGFSHSTKVGAEGNAVLKYVTQGSYTLRIQIPNQPEFTLPVQVFKGEITDLGTIVRCADNDGDGFNPNPLDLVTGNDCNDNNPTINPNATELCDGVDNDCDGTTDGAGCAACTDGDNDGFFAQDGCGSLLDCDDTNNTVRPFAAELCDGVDNNCDTFVDEGFDLDNDVNNCGGCGNVCAGTCTLGVCSDGDGDGFEPPQDCNDSDPNVFPGAAELCDGIDNNCDGNIDEGNPEGNAACNTGQPGECSAGVTVCQTGVLLCQSVNPPTAEICDGLDNNCDGTTDEGNVCSVCGDGVVGSGETCDTAGDSPTCDSDCTAVLCGDSHVNTPAGETCDDGGESATCDSDCTTAVCGDSTLNTTAGETCDDGGESAACDSNCTSASCGDGQVNATAGETCDDGNTVSGDGCSSTCQSETADGDGDGFTIAQGDCDDGNADIHPGAADVPDFAFVDSNCDGIDGDESRAVFVATTGSNVNPGTRAAPVQTIGQGLALAVGGKDHVYISEGTYNEGVNLVNGVSMWGRYSASNDWMRNAAFQTNITGTQVVGNAVIGARGQNITTPTTFADLHVNTPDASTSLLTNYGVHCSSCSGLILSGNVVNAGNGGPGISGSNGSSGASGGNGSNGFSGSCDGSPGIGGLGGSSFCSRTGGNGGRGGDGPEDGLDGGSGIVGVSGGTGGAQGDPGGPGTSGDNGGSGSNGANGAGGNGGFVSSGFWQGSNGVAGSNGAHGNGGGGGGGGGGQTGFFVNDGGGNGAGGGGGGGCRGLAGSGGSAGGGSFGLFLVSSTGTTLSGNTITSGNGGNGGTGGSGGNGGVGGNRGLGASTCTSEVGAGGNGGFGGNGGNGGHGGGGAGGVSFAIGRFNTTVSTSGNTLSSGSGGSGGISPGNSGTTGASGTIQ